MKRKNYMTILLAAVFFSGNCGVTPLEGSSVKFLGAASQVSGSCYYFQTKEINFLVDCGFYYPENQAMEYEKDKKFTNDINTQVPVSPQSISAIVITHSHLDHIGKIPLFVKHGFNGRIISTKLTKELSLVMMEMILKGTDMGQEYFTKSSNSKVVHSQKKCIWVGKIKRPKKIKMNRGQLFDQELRLCSGCLKIEVDQIRVLFETYDYNQKAYLGDKISIELFDAKHIPGSSSVLVSLESEGKKVFVTGDVGSGLDNILKGEPNLPDEIDYIFMESTYGGQSRVLAEDPFRAFYSYLNNALAEDRIIWIPCFVLDRTQKVLNSIRIGQKRGLIPSNINIKIVSSTAKKINRIYDQNYNYKPKYVDESLSMSPEKLLENMNGPIILITPSYLDDLDFFHPVMKKMFQSNQTDVLIVGYQDPRSIGGLLKTLSKNSKIKLGYENIRVASNVQYYGGIFSGHIDANGIVNYLKSIKINKSIVLVHGDVSSLNSLKGMIEPFFQNEIIVPESKSSLLLE